MAREKKFFVPELRTYNNDLDKRWRVEYWEPITPVRSKRIVLYGKINSGKTVEDRMRIAFELINSLSFVKEKEKTIIDIVIDNAALHLRRKTISGYRGIADKYLAFLAKIAPETATEKNVNDFLLKLHNEKVNSNTIAKYRISLHALYSKAIEMKLTAFNPVTKVASIKKRPKSLYFFNDSQIQQIKDATKDTQLWLAIRLLFYCFIRPTEMRGLKIQDINFEYGFIEVPGEISKNKKTEKVIIPSHFLKEIEYLKSYPNNYYILSSEGHPGSTQIGQNRLNNEHSAVLNKLEIRGRYAFYSWKHTGAVKAVKAGINLKDLQMQLRHHSLDMVNEYLKNLGVMDSEDLKKKFPVL
jgi:integrase